MRRPGVAPGEPAEAAGAAGRDPAATFVLPPRKVPGKEGSDDRRRPRRAEGGRPRSYGTVSPSPLSRRRFWTSQKAASSENYLEKVIGREKGVVTRLRNDARRRFVGRGGEEEATPPA